MLPTAVSPVYPFSSQSPLLMWKRRKEVHSRVPKSIRISNSLLALLQLDLLNGGARIQHRSHLKAPSLDSHKGKTENKPREVTEKEWCGHRKDNAGWENPRTKYQTLQRGPKKQPLITQSVDD